MSFSSSDHPVKKLRIGLLTTIDTNIGDDFIREGLVHVLQQLAPGRAFVFEQVNKHRPHTVYPGWHPIRLSYIRGSRLLPKRDFVRSQLGARLAPWGLSRFDRCDIILQCGTPVIWDGCRNSEWAQPIWQNVLARLARSGPPILNLGGGTCYPWERQPATLVGNPDEEFVRTMLGATRLTTARDRLMPILCRSIGHDIPLIPCPALLAGQAYTQPAPPKQKVLVNYMAGGGHYDFDQGVDGTRWEQTMRRVIEYLRQANWQPLLLAHNAAELSLNSRLWPDLPRACPGNASEYFAIARDAAFGVVNRMHASVVLAGLGIPSVAAGTDTRNLMVEALGLPVFYIKDATPEVMIDAIDRIIATRELETRRLLLMREQTLAAYRACLQPFLSPAGSEFEEPPTQGTAMFRFDADAGLVVPNANFEQIGDGT